MSVRTGSRAGTSRTRFPASNTAIRPCSRSATWTRPARSTSNDDGPTVADSSPTERPALPGPLPHGMYRTVVPGRRRSPSAGGSSTVDILPATYSCSVPAGGSVALCPRASRAEIRNTIRPPGAARDAAPERHTTSTGIRIRSPDRTRTGDRAKIWMEAPAPDAAACGAPAAGTAGPVTAIAAMATAARATLAARAFFRSFIVSPPHDSSTPGPALPAPAGRGGAPRTGPRRSPGQSPCGERRQLPVAPADVSQQPPGRCRPPGGHRGEGRHHAPGHERVRLVTGGRGSFELHRSPRLERSGRLGRARGTEEPRSRGDAVALRIRGHLPALLLGRAQAHGRRPSPEGLEGARRIGPRKDHHVVDPSDVRQPLPGENPIDRGQDGVGQHGRRLGSHGEPPDAVGIEALQQPLDPPDVPGRRAHGPERLGHRAQADAPVT